MPVIHHEPISWLVRLPYPMKTVAIDEVDSYEVQETCTEVMARLAVLAKEARYLQEVRVTPAVITLQFAVVAFWDRAAQNQVDEIEATLVKCGFAAKKDWK